MLLFNDGKKVRRRLFGGEMLSSYSGVLAMVDLATNLAEKQRVIYYFHLLVFFITVKKLYCDKCIKQWYPDMTVAEIVECCPFCRKTCNCNACLCSSGVIKGVIVVLNFQSATEAENWGIDFRSINESCQRNNILMISYSIRLYLIFPLSSQIIKATCVVKNTAWAGAAYYLLLYMFHF
ncbi:hypothetical protein K1719_003542 [Acacia pycnantha]|nr:hypothetical protein K1719_003542 [Acacia pycnantha]